MSSPTLIKLTAVNEVSKDVFASESFPEKLGNILPIGYGGCTTAIAVRSAYRTVNDGFHAISVLGSFHGPTKVDRNLKCHVFRTRQTRTFATRRVVVSQTQDDGSDRMCAEMFVDFHVSENGVFEYSTPPSREYRIQPLDPQKTAQGSEIAYELVKDGRLPKKVADFQLKAYSMTESLYEIRLCRDGIFGQNGWGTATKVATTQDDRQIYDKTSADWFRAREPLGTEADNVAALAWHLDGGLSFLPLFHDHKSLFDAGPATTLDFALRILRPEVRTDSWLLREMKSVAAHGARTYSESRVWNEAGDLVAVMTQTCICRPLDKLKKGKTKL